MRFIVQAIVLATATVAAAQPHRHAHRHLNQHGSPVEASPAIVTEVIPAVQTIYILNGKLMTAAEVEAGLADGKYAIVEDEVSVISTVFTPTSTPAPSSSSTSISSFTPTPSSSSSSTSSFYTPSSSSTSSAEEYYQVTSSSSSSVAPTSSSVAPSSTYTSAASSSSSAASSSSSSSSSSTTGIDADFPSGEIDCSNFPSDYGALYVDWLGYDGYVSVQQVPGYSLGDLLISEIVEALTGVGCTENSYCSYACPAGYQKSQWPTAQGSTGQSIGGLYCNTDGKLELSNTNYTTLCIKGATDGISVKNKLSKDVAICRTDYPGSESEVVPATASAGGSVAITSPDESSYYYWQGKATSAQYYINPAGYGESDACTWGESGTNLGNWAPVNLGVGTTDGITYIGLFQNSPTNTDGVLDFDIAITGDVSSDCSYSGGKYYMDGVESSSGCTIAVPEGGSAEIVFS